MKPATPVKVRFQSSGKKISCVHCHCTICQRLHGARFATVALFEHFAVTCAAEMNYYLRMDGNGSFKNIRQLF